MEVSYIQMIFPFKKGDFSGSMLSFLECTPKQIILEASLPKTNIAPENRPCFKPKQSPNHCSLSIFDSFWVFREGTYHPLKKLIMTMILQTSFLSCLHVFLVASLICLVCSAIQCLKGVRVSWMMFQWTKHLQLIGSRRRTSTVVLWRDDTAIHSTVCRQIIYHLPKTWVKKYKTKNKTSPTRWSKVTFLSPSWRSLNLWKGHLSTPKKVTKNCQKPCCSQADTAALQLMLSGTKASWTKDGQSLCLFVA